MKENFKLVKQNKINFNLMELNEIMKWNNMERSWRERNIENRI